MQYKQHYALGALKYWLLTKPNHHHHHQHHHHNHHHHIHHHHHLIIIIDRASDIYAFGTVWYELLTGEWPWKEQPPEAIIWQVGQ